MGETGSGAGVGLLLAAGLSLFVGVGLPLVAVIGLDGGFGRGLSSGGSDLAPDSMAVVVSRQMPGPGQPIRADRLSRVWRLGPVSGCGQSVWLIELVSGHGRVYCRLLADGGLEIDQVVGFGQILGRAEPPAIVVEDYRGPTVALERLWPPEPLIDI